jgi:hypothetical protein
VAPGPKPFTWRQKLVLRAASAVDYLPFPTSGTNLNIRTGVYRTLVKRGFLATHRRGWVLTNEGKKLTLWWDERDREANAREDVPGKFNGFARPRQQEST